MKNIPQYSNDLIEMLDEQVKHPELPYNMKGWAGLNEGELRRGAFIAGQRALVNDLVQALREDNGIDTHDGGQSPMDSTGQKRESMAPVHLASSDFEEIHSPNLRREDISD